MANRQHIESIFFPVELAIKEKEACTSDSGYYSHGAIIPDEERIGG
jgi:hypothetical protein